MVQQNMLDIENEVTHAGLEVAGRHGLGVTIMEPLRGGGLAFAPAPVKAVYERSDFPERTPVEWAFRHLINSTYVSSIPSGMSSIAQVKENVKMFSQDCFRPNCLSQAEQETISAARNAYNSIVSIPCTTCDYCVPCPTGVQIPGIFSQYNEFEMFERKNMNPRRVYMFTTRAGGDVSKCNACGKCVKKCPQNINIPQDLQTAHEVLKGWNE
jgi:predicted aldo/keto reductase-like oxidoreductase